MSKQIISLFVLLFACTTLVQAESVQTEPLQGESTKLQGNIAVHIAKTHYLRPVRFLHPYLNVWQMQGPLAEQAAMASLKNSFTNINECATDSEADVVLLLEPHIFYNAQLRVFHAEYIARAYTNDITPITRIKKQASEIGALGIAPDFHVRNAYSKAIKKIIGKLANDQDFLATLNQNKPIKAGTLCNQLDNLPFDKLYY